MQQQAAPGGSTETASKEAASRQQGHIIDYGLRFVIPASREKPGLSESLGVFALSMRLRIGHTGGHSICLGN